MQPVQDLSIDTAVSATAISVHAREPGSRDAAGMDAEGARAPRARSPRSSTSPATCSRTAGRCTVDHRPRRARRASASRRRSIDNALYDAYGQRIISTIFTQSNQYRVILDIDPAMTRSLDSLNDDLSAVVRLDHGPGAADAIAKLEVKQSPLQISHLKQFPVTTISFNLAPGASLGARGRRDRRGAGRHRPAGELRHQLPGRRAGVPVLAVERGVPAAGGDRWRCISCSACSTRASSTRSRFSRRCRRPASARCSRSNCAGAGLDIIGVIGIVLLIGIVKKNAIMMIDFALDAQRIEGLAAARGDLPGLPAAAAADPDDDGRGDVRRAAADAGNRRRLRAAPSARPRDRRRPRVQPGADAVHDAGDLSLLRAASAQRLGARRAGGAAARRRRREQPLLRALHPAAGRDDAADDRHRARRACSPSASCRSRRCRRSIFATISVYGEHARGEPRHDGDLGRRAARAPSRPDRRRQRDDLAELARQHAHHACNSASTATSTARRATCRRRSTPRAPTCRPACSANPTYHKFNPADAPIMVLALTSTTRTAGPALRRRLQRSAAAAVAARRHRRGRRRRQRAAGGPGRAQSRARCSNTASASRTCAPRSPPPTPTARRARSRTTTSTTRSTPTTRRPRPTQYRDLVVAYRNSAAVKLSDVAEVVDSVEDLRNAGLANGKPAVGHRAVAPARRQHHRGGRRREGGTAAADRGAAGRRRSDRRRRPLDHHPRLARRHRDAR